MSEKTVMFFVEKERARVIALVKAIRDRDFLVFCIENAVTVPEIPIFRKRFTELGGDDIEELM